MLDSAQCVPGLRSSRPGAGETCVLLRADNSVLRCGIYYKQVKSVVLSIEFLKDFNLSMTSRMEFKYIFIVPMFFVL